MSMYDSKRSKITQSTLCSTGIIKTKGLAVLKNLIYFSCIAINGQASVGEGIIFEQECYISALKHIRMLLLRRYVLLACINIIYKNGNFASLFLFKA